MAYTSIALPLALAAQDQHAVQVADVLSAAGRLPVEAVVVSSPGLDHTEDVAAAHERLAGVSRARVAVLEADDEVDALEQWLLDRPKALPVVATRAPGWVGRLLTGSVTEALYARLDRPMVLVGPRAVSAPRRPMLLLDARRPAVGHLVGDVLDDWLGTFDGEISIVRRGDDIDPARDEGLAGRVLVLHPEPSAAHRVWESVRRAPCPVLVVP
jgi:hypothetical protein